MATLKSTMLRHSATLKIPAGVTDWQENTSESSLVLDRIHVQRMRGIEHDSINNEVQARATLWFDAKLSTPHGTNLLALKTSADAVGASLNCEYDGYLYTVSKVEEYLDGFGRLHHYEVEMS